ncbi:MAG: hypothetical protein LC098_11740 [Burkholderiales bacterium]|nr:hypothetical protein [Burkholderiales bacterium]
MARAWCRAAIAACLAAVGGASSAQTAGEWRYQIATDMKGIPPDMRVNFPTIQFKACLSAEDFTTGRAFALQTAPGSSGRCPSVDFERQALLRIAPGAAPADAPQGIRFRYACDGGKTLDGTANGRVSNKRFEVHLDSRYIPPSQGIEHVRQTMSARYLGPCPAAKTSR